jgi:hypothetical protein
MQMPEGGTIFDIKREEIPVEKGEPLALELASFVKCVRESLAPKVGTELGKTALEIALQITALIRENPAAAALA